MLLFSTPWGNFRWLGLSFCLTIAGDVFQERLNRILRSVFNIHNITNDVLSHGKAESLHATVTTLIETTRANNITFNAENFSSRLNTTSSLERDIKLNPRRHKSSQKLTIPELSRTLELLTLREPS